MKAVSTGNNLTANTLTTVFTVPTGYYCKWNLCYISNHTGSNKNVSVWWYDSSDSTEVTIIDAYSLDARKFLQFGGSGSYVVLEEGDQVRIISETGSSMSATNTFELYRKGE